MRALSEPKGALLNYTSTKPVWETVGEIQGLLAKHGATHVMTKYAENGGGAITGIAFVVPTEHGPRQFELPVQVEGVQQRLLEIYNATPSGQGMKKRGGKPDGDRARIVAWRILKDWLEAQLALVEIGMAQVDQVMLPYMHIDDKGTTLYQRYALHAGSLELASGD